MNRKQINLELDRIISRHRDGSGSIPAMNVSGLRRDLVAHMDATVEAALSEDTK